MIEQRTATGTRSQGALASLGRALAGDADLGTRVGTALAGPLAAGLAAGAALAALLDRPGGAPDWALWALTGACVGALVGLALAAWAVADRRHLRRARRARLRANAALVAGALAVLLIGLARAPSGASTRIALSAALAVAVGLFGAFGMRAAGRLAARAMAE